MSYVYHPKGIDYFSYLNLFLYGISETGCDGIREYIDSIEMASCQMKRTGVQPTSFYPL